MSSETKEILEHYGRAVALVKEERLPHWHRAGISLYAAGMSFIMTKIGVPHEAVPVVKLPIDLEGIGQP